MTQVAESSAAGSGDAAGVGARPARRAPIDVRSASLFTLALLASIFMLRWAGAVFVPLLLGLMASYALSPAVNQLERLHLPRALAAGLLLSLLLAGLGTTVYAYSGDAAALLESLPDAAQKLGDALHAKGGAPVGAIANVQKAATRLERAAEESDAVAAHSARGVTRVEIARPRFSVKDFLWSSSFGLGSLLGQALVVGFIAYFLLASGDTFRRKMARIAGPQLSRRKAMIQALDEITGQIQRYLMVLLLTSAGVGVATWLVVLGLGLQHAAVWGLAAAALNLVPYLGSLAICAGVALTAFLQFGSVDMALLVGGAALLVHLVSGNLVTPWLTGRASRMNPVAILVGLLALGWLWGLWGLLLGVPLLTVFKAVCDRVDDLRPIGELLAT